MGLSFTACATSSTSSCWGKAEMRHGARALMVLLAATSVLGGCTPLIVAGGAGAAVVASDRRTAGAVLDDETIEIKVNSAIAGERDLKEQAHINATSLNGMVLLTGEAPTTALRDRVLALTRDIPGVRRTVNEIRIAAPSAFGDRSRDAWLTAKVKTRLANTQELNSWYIKVVTENAAVYLLGLVRREQGALATEAARTVGGVERVVKLFEYID